MSTTQAANRKSCGLVYPPSLLSMEPDPCQPAFPHLYRNAAAHSVGKRWISQQERRSVILAATRQLMIEVGCESVCFRDIAELCGIAVQTIYNIVGDRSHVMTAATTEWIHWLAAAATPQSPDASRTLAVLEALWMSAVTYPDYTTNAVRGFYRPQSPLFRVFHTITRNVIRNGLADLHSRSLTRPLIDIDALAGQLTQSIQAGVCNKVLYPDDHNEFRREFAYGPGLMLLGAICDAEAEKVERELDVIACCASA